MKRIIAIVISLAAILPLVSAATPSRSLTDLGKKAERFFDQKEWASASAMYSLMIDQRPDSARLYGPAVVAAGMRRDATGQRELLRQALHAKVPLDSLFRYVEASGFGLGRADLYECFLKLAAETEPWMSRKIDAALLDYYSFRRDGAAMVEYSRKLLAGVPDNELFGLRLAEGLLIEGRDSEAAQAFERVLSSHPESLTALLYLGEMALARGDNASALRYFTRANGIDSTPHLLATIRRLTPHP